MQTSNNKKLACYTCMTGNYDTLSQHTYVHANCDYFCFTDNEKMIEQKKVGHWNIIAVEDKNLDSHFTNRWYKFFPYEFLQEYDESIYIDANVNVLTNLLFQDVERLPEDVFLSLSQHAVRSCVYKEGYACVILKKDTKENIFPQLVKYKEEGFPEDFGLSDNSIIYRKHNHLECISIMKDWWKEIQSFSKRDQVSLMYVLWKHRLDLHYLSKKSYRTDYKNFKVVSHRLRNRSLL